MNRVGLIAIAVVSIAGLGSAAYAGESVTAESVLQQLKALEGRWQSENVTKATPGEESAEPAAKLDHQFEVSGGGSVVVETMFQGTEFEMINMIHVDGEELVLTHYCAGGNQPQMRLNREKSTPEHLVFDFTGGTNLDAAHDDHIHDAEFFLLDDNRVKSAWTGFSKGEAAGVSAFNLTRVD